jgi:hypothetical protein
MSQIEKPKVSPSMLKVEVKTELGVVTRCRAKQYGMFALHQAAAGGRRAKQ